MGIVTMVAAEVFLFGGVSLIAQWITPIMWTGYILTLDAIVRFKRGTSLLSDYRVEFGLLAVISIGSWLIFEGYNVFLKNWWYVGLPENIVERYFGYAWAFATISPGMFLTYEVLDLSLPGGDGRGYPRLDRGEAPGRPRLPAILFTSFIVLGLICLIVPLVWPSTYMAPFLWMAFAFLIDPINGRIGERSFLSEFFTGCLRPTLVFFLAGLVCGALWEFWNYWATSKWHYDIPRAYLGHVKLFEMPVLGFLGFMPFAIESYAIYVFVRRLIPIERRVQYLG